jgi:ATP-dependent DNA helicase RecG
MGEGRYLMRLRESETLEFKKSTSELKEAIISIVSILNKHQRGKLYFGVKKNGIVVGQQVGHKTIRDISQAISNHIEPKSYPTIDKVVLDDKECILVEFEGTETPYYAFGRAYMRVGDEDRQLSSKELESLILRKNKDKLRWDTQVCDKAKLSDISSVKLKQFLKNSGLKYDTIENSLEKLKLIFNGKLLNSAVMIFGKKPYSFFPNARLRCAVFGTTDTSYIIDMQDFEGDLFYLIKRAEEYILEHIHIGMKLDGLRRLDVPEIDREAFREAIINAFCHRDYYEYDSVNIAVFKDRVEIRSPGLLYGNLTIEQIKREMVSERRNELIAELFHRIHFIEKWGRGISLILSREPDADFKEVGNHFITVFRRKEVKEIPQKTRVKTRVKTREKIIRLIQERPKITMKEMAERTGLSIKGVEWNIRKLKEEGILRRVGPAKGGYWEVVKQSREGGK